MAAALALASVGAAAQRAAEPFNPSPNAIEIPGWFQLSFLDFREDIREATRAGKRLMVYFGQDGCPYCARLMGVNFSQMDIVDKTRRHFDAIAINIWGDRDVTWIDGTVRSEKDFAAFMKVQFTPTMLFFDEKGGVALRLNGYYPPHKFRVALDYVAGKNDGKITFGEFLKRNVGEPGSGKLHPQAFFLKPPYRLDPHHRQRGKPLAVLFEQPNCAACDELHTSGFKDPAVLELIGKFDVARLDRHGTQPVVTPGGRSLTEAAWAKALGIAYTPSVVFFDAAGSEVFRIEAYLRPFHFASSFDYVASGAYRREPSFQRYIQARAQKLREQDRPVELW
ncbi:MAG: thioredoxin fold domain-containing protein [Betaproteobacteria bacterium]|nr:thioredoxin fold domain-containing protein [Betaproteobacteria bacterium]